MFAATQRITTLSAWVLATSPGRPLESMGLQIEIVQMLVSHVFLESLI